MMRFKSARHAQRFLSTFGTIYLHFRVGRHLVFRQVSALRVMPPLAFNLTMPNRKLLLNYCWHNVSEGVYLRSLIHRHPGR